MWSIIGIWNSHTGIIITGIMILLQSTMLTPTPPDQDEEKASPRLCVKSQESIQTNHKRVRISKSKMKEYMSCSVSLLSSLLTLPHFPSLSLQRGSALPLPHSFPSALPQGARVLSSRLLPCCSSLEENLHCKFQLKTNIHGWVMNPQRDRWWSGLKRWLFAFGSKPH